MSKKKLVFLVLSSVYIALFLASCNKKVSTSICKTNDDCKADAIGKSHNGVCFMGKCEECVENTDCSDLKQCVKNRCVEGVAHKEDNKVATNPSLSKKCEGLGKVHFEFDQYTVDEQYQANLDKLAQCLQDNPEITMIIEGHADSRGTPTYNMALSEKRANAVKNYLIQRRGIASIRLKTVSYGNEKPVVDEQNEYAFQQNRRTEFLLADMQ